MEFIRNLAKVHNLRIIIKRLDEGLRAYLMDGVVYLHESLPQERMNFAFCHELAHHLLNHHNHQVLSEEMEREANEMAADLLLPPETFRQDALMYPLDQLKELYPQASWEVIARSRLRWVPAILTIIDNGQRTLRITPDDYQFPYHLLPVEEEVYRRCMETRGHVSSEGISVQTHGYFVDSGEGVARVILWTEIDQ